MTAPMEFQSIPAAGLPHTTHLYRAFLENFHSVSEFYSHRPSLEGARRAAAEVRYPAEMRTKVVARLREQNQMLGSGAQLAKNLDRLSAGAVAIVTGQQVNLFSGPSYTFYKALTAIRLAEEMTSAGIDAVPVFWLAAEDHDLDEVNHCFWLEGTELSRLELEGADAKGQSVGAVRLGDGVLELVNRAVATLKGPGAEVVSEALRASYTPDQTFSSALGRLIARLLGDKGLILLDSLDPELHRLAAPVYMRALDEHEALSGRLAERAELLAKRGFHAQVKTSEQGTLLFWSANGPRLPIRSKETLYLVGEREFSPAAIRAAIEKSPEQFSGNVLLRPIVQDTLLPTAAYVAGPAETAYFAQVAVVYSHLIGRMPAILPRASVTIVGPHVARLLEKYKLEVTDAFGGTGKLRELMEREAMPASLAERFKAGEKAVKEFLEGLREPLGSLDKTLLGALETAESKMLYQYQALEQKAGRASAFRSGIIENHANEISAALYPEGQLQERVHCLLPAIASNGLQMIGELADRIEPGKANHLIVRV